MHVSVCVCVEAAWLPIKTADPDGCDVNQDFLHTTSCPALTLSHSASPAFALLRRVSSSEDQQPKGSVFLLQPFSLFPDALRLFFLCLSLQRRE